MAFDALPQGVRLIPDLISDCLEDRLVEALSAGAWQEDAAGHRAQQFGWWRPRTHDDVGTPERFLGPLPDWAAPIVSRLHVLAPFDLAPDHLVVRDFSAGAVPDLRRGEGRVVATVALLGDLPMQFRRREAQGAWHLTLPRQGALVLTERFDAGWDRALLPTGTPVPDRLMTLTFRRGA
ncbi:MAG: hypothetical protein AAFU80_00035 [Pseudomonadota bacterium]